MAKASRFGSLTSARAARVRGVEGASSGYRLEAIALGRPLLVAAMHHHQVAEAQMVRRHGGVEALRSGDAATIEDEANGAIGRQTLRVQESLRAASVDGGEGSILGRDGESSREAPVAVVNFVRASMITMLSPRSSMLLSSRALITWTPSDSTSWYQCGRDAAARITAETITSNRMVPASTAREMPPWGMRSDMEGSVDHPYVVFHSGCRSCGPAPALPVPPSHGHALDGVCWAEHGRPGTARTGRGASCG